MIQSDKFPTLQGRALPRVGNEGGQEGRGRDSREQTATYPDYSQRSRPYAIPHSSIAKCVSDRTSQLYP